MYAIVQQGGHQFRVSPGDRLVVDRLTAEVGSVVALEPVLLVHDGSEATVGTPIVDGTRVAAVVVSHTQGKKLRVFKYKPKKRYRRTMGHRSQLTELRIEAVVAAGEDLPAAPAPVARKAAATPQARTAKKAGKAEKAEKADKAEKAAAPAAEVEETLEPEAAVAETAAADDVEADEVAAPVARTTKPRARAKPKSDDESGAADAAVEE